MYRRFVQGRLEAALADTRVVLLNGARQTGKSTLAKQLAAERGGRYVTLDDPTIAGLANSDPDSLVRSAGDFTVIDEVQHAPVLFPALKRVVDEDGRPGRFLLTGSANVFLLPKLSESLAGRMEIVPLAPLSQGELAGEQINLVDQLFDAQPLSTGTLVQDRLEMCERVVTGGFPEVVARPAGDRREAWFRSYVAALLQRDVRDLANIEGLTAMPRLFALLAARSSALMNIAEVSRATGIAHSTLQRYLALLQSTFLLQPLLAWSSNAGKRLVKAPKIHLLDSGLAAHLRGDLDPLALSTSPSLGPLLETFVVTEVRKQIGWSRQTITPFHFRSTAGHEVDLVLEGAGQRIAGIEIKASASVKQVDFAGLRILAEAAGDKFTRGVVLYLGGETLPFGDNLWAAPLAALWQKAKATPRA